MRLKSHLQFLDILDLRRVLNMGESIMHDRPISPYDRMLLEDIQILGGFYNAHAHLDRADTLDDKYLRHINTTPLEASSLPLSVKQNLTGDLHRGVAYTKENLAERVRRVVERQIAYGVTKLDTCCDATPDLADDGLIAIHELLAIKKEFEKRIKIRVGPMPIFGFKEGSGRMEVFEIASRLEGVDFLACLPEKDDYSNPENRDGKIGYRNHIRRVVALGCELKKEVHIHVDQANDPAETGTETLIEGLRWIDQPSIPDHTGPTIWAVHMISTSAYEEDRFARIIDGLLELNIGVIVCPSAALSMRQLRPVKVPSHNSIARVLELIKRQVPLRLGTDNICDVYVPQGDGDPLTEIKIAGHAVRLAIPYVWAKLSAGHPLNDVDRATVGRVLYQDTKAFTCRNPNWQPAVD